MSDDVGLLIAARMLFDIAWHQTTSPAQRFNISI
jgi:hypothetical protein